jgi:hypothetical protein
MVTVIELEPLLVAEVESSSWLGLLLVSVTVTPPAEGTWPRSNVPASWRPAPIGIPSVIPRPGVRTVATTDPFCGAENPAGTPAANVVFPAVAGWKRVVALKDPPAIVTGDVTMVPTLGFELVTATLTEVPPATGCTAARFRDESKTAAITLIEVGAAPLVVKKSGEPGPLGPATKKPEGASVTVPVAVPNPGALAV